MEETEQELVGQTGGAVNLLLILHCYRRKGEDTHENKKEHLISVLMNVNGMQVVIGFVCFISLYRLNVFILMGVHHCLIVRSECRTCTECEEKDLDLLALWKQLNEVKLERNHLNAVLRGQGFSCTYTQEKYILQFTKAFKKE